MLGFLRPIITVWQDRSSKYHKILRGEEYIRLCWYDFVEFVGVVYLTYSLVFPTNLQQLRERFFKGRLYLLFNGSAEKSNKKVISSWEKLLVSAEHGDIILNRSSNSMFLYQKSIKTAKTREFKWSPKCLVTRLLPPNFKFIIWKY